MKNKQLLIVLLGLTACCIFTGCKERAKPSKSPMNVLFIAVDDLRPELGCYGNQIIQSPNIDKLANEGVVFTRAYTQQAICGPSRASLMSGLRPDYCGVTHNRTYFRNTVPEVVTLPQYFLQHGYITYSIGKIYHGGQDDPEKSWSVEPFIPRQPYELGDRRNQVTISDDVPDNAYRDGQSAEEAMRILRLLKETKKPFFLGVGFYKPHLSWHCPKKYWDIYDPDQIELADVKIPPKGSPSISLHNSYELRVRDGVPDSDSIEENLSHHLKHGYYACVSYIDAQLGKILDELDKLGMRENTIIMLWGDHGWHLGDYGVWGKASNYEFATRVPLIVSVPGMKGNGKSSEALVGLLDMYPTLCDLVNLPIPSHVQGQSFSHILNDPESNGKDAVFSQFPCPALREWAALPLNSQMRGKFKVFVERKESQIKQEFGENWSRDLFENHLMGYTMRTDQYRFTRWVDLRNPEKSLAVELYDHQTDPNETVNLANKPEYNELVKELEKQMIQAGISATPVLME